MTEVPAGLALGTALAGVAFAWAWVVAALFVGQERAMGDVSQSCMLGGAAAALAAFAVLDLSGTRGPELGRAAMRAAATAVSACTLLVVLTPAGEAVPTPLVNVTWCAYGVVGAYAQRRSFHLLASLAQSLDGRCVLRVACAVLALSTLLGLMAARMSVSDGAVFMITSAAVAIWLLPQGRLALGAAVQARARRKIADGAARLLAPFAFMFVAMGFTCGFHTSVGRVLYSGGTRFSNVFFVMFAACAACALIGKRSHRQGTGVPAVALQVPLACACVAFVPLLFLNDRPDNLLWEIFQNTLVLLSTCALLASLSMVACADGTATASGGPAGPGRGSAPFCAVGLAAFALGLFGGWLAGQATYDAGGATGMAFRLGVTACIALLVAAVLVASNPMAQGALPARGAGAPGKEPVAAGPDGVAGTPRANAEPAGESRDDGGNPREAVARGAAEDPYGPFCARYGLSEREHVLLALLAQGLNAQQAAESLCVSRNTVKSHMAHIYTKCGVHTRSELDELLENRAAG